MRVRARCADHLMLSIVGARRAIIIGERHRFAVSEAL
jgi:hypothetical protein